MQTHSKLIKSPFRRIHGLVLLENKEFEPVFTVSALEFNNIKKQNCKVGST